MTALRAAEVIALPDVRCRVGQDDARVGLTVDGRELGGREGWPCRVRWRERNDDEPTHAVRARLPSRHELRQGPSRRKSEDTLTVHEPAAATRPAPVRLGQGISAFRESMPVP